jgi:hypothetical protein
MAFVAIEVTAGISAHASQGRNLYFGGNVNVLI